MLDLKDAVLALNPIVRNRGNSDLNSGSDSFLNISRASTSLRVSKVVENLWKNGRVSSQIEQIYRDFRSPPSFENSLRGSLNSIKNFSTLFVTKLEMFTKIMINFFDLTVNKLNYQIRNLKKFKRKLKIWMVIVCLNPYSRRSVPLNTQEVNTEEIENFEISRQSHGRLSIHEDRDRKGEFSNLQHMRKDILMLIECMINEKQTQMENLKDRYELLFCKNILSKRLKEFERCKRCLTSLLSKVIRKVMEHEDPQNVGNVQQLFKIEYEFLLAMKSLGGIFSEEMMDELLSYYETIFQQEEGFFLALIKKITTFNEDCAKIYPNWDNMESVDMVNKLNKIKFRPRQLLDDRYWEFMQKKLGKKFDRKPKILGLLKEFMGSYKIMVQKESSFSCITLPAKIREEDRRNDSQVLIAIDVKFQIFDFQIFNHFHILRNFKVDSGRGHQDIKAIITTISLKGAKLVTQRDSGNDILIMVGYKTSQVTAGCLPVEKKKLNTIAFSAKEYKMAIQFMKVFHRLSKL